MSAATGATCADTVGARGVIAEAITRLTAAGVDTPAVDARLIAAHVLAVSAPQLVLIDTISPQEAATISTLVERRVRREPLQWILGTAAFGPLDLAVGPGVFIPRPETELLAEWAVAHAAPASPASPLRVLDICTGSGALAAYISHELPHAHVIGVDVSPTAVEYARKNAPTAHILRADLAQLPCAADTFDCVVCNPPYVPEIDPATGHPTVVSEEVTCDPHEAVFAGADGMGVMAPLAASCYRVLRPGAIVAVEHDDSHQAQVIEIFQEAGFVDVVGHTDYAGRPRFITARTQ
ncbi:MAG: peptide chain release factor N(5)-glutamine methyltransferase [Corynebacterium sp.]|nr:peptide chain release factor N(5)-glutamine methyltransferase [Corynebacterium sp.]